MTPRLAAELRAYRLQSGELADWVAGLRPDALHSESALPGWSLQHLLTHIAQGAEALRDGLASRGGGRARPLSEYVRVLTPAGGEAGATAPAGPSSTRADPAVALVELEQQLRDAVPEQVDAPDTAVVVTPRGAITALDLVRLRVVGLVVHCDDVARSVPDNDAVPLVRAALASATRTLAQILAEQAAGRSVEVRIPPFVAVQAVAGPRHTRGTPPNVVETDPLTWLRLATGRAQFAAEVTRGAVRATGPRSDLSAHLPVLT